jgi:hypothetical protein
MHRYLFIVMIAGFVLAALILDRTDRADELDAKQPVRSRVEDKAASQAANNAIADDTGTVVADAGDGSREEEIRIAAERAEEENRKLDQRKKEIIDQLPWAKEKEDGLCDQLGYVHPKSASNGVNLAGTVYLNRNAPAGKHSRTGYLPIGTYIVNDDRPLPQGAPGKKGYAPFTAEDGQSGLVNDKDRSSPLTTLLAEWGTGITDCSEVAALVFPNASLSSIDLVPLVGEDGKAIGFGDEPLKGVDWLEKSGGKALEITKVAYNPIIVLEKGIMEVDPLDPLVAFRLRDGRVISGVDDPDKTLPGILLVRFSLKRMPTKISDWRVGYIKLDKIDEKDRYEMPDKARLSWLPSSLSRFRPLPITSDHCKENLLECVVNDLTRDLAPLLERSQYLKKATTVQAVINDLANKVLEDACSFSFEQSFDAVKAGWGLAIPWPGITAEFGQGFSISIKKTFPADQTSRFNLYKNFGPDMDLAINKTLRCEKDPAHTERFFLKVHRKNRSALEISGPVVRDHLDWHQSTKDVFSLPVHPPRPGVTDETMFRVRYIRNDHGKEYFTAMLKFEAALRGALFERIPPEVDRLLTEEMRDRIVATLKVLLLQWARS